LVYLTITQKMKTFAMDLKCKLLLCSMLLAAFFCQAQTLTVKNKSAKKFGPVRPDFRFINASLDTSSIEPVATIKVSCIRNTGNVASLFGEIKEKANELGANAFRLNEYEKGSGVNTHLILDVYYATDSILKLNTSLHPKNLVYIFPEQSGALIERTQKVFINDTAVEFAPNEVLVYTLQENESIKINKRGLIKGNDTTIKWAPNAAATYLSLEELKYNANINRGGGIEIGVKIKPSMFIAMNRNLGYLLLQTVFTEKQYIPNK
jgi:hypothetical protein